MDSPALDPFATAGRFPYPRRAASTPGCEFCTKRRAYFEKQRGNHPKTRGFCTKRPDCAQFNKKHGFRKETKVVMERHGWDDRLRRRSRLRKNFCKTRVGSTQFARYGNAHERHVDSPIAMAKSSQIARGSVSINFDRVKMRAAE
jgi:hypothetical protein